MYKFALAVIRPCRAYIDRSASQEWDMAFTRGEFLAEVVIEVSAIEGLVGRVMDGRQRNEIFFSKYGALELLETFDEGDE